MLPKHRRGPWSSTEDQYLLELVRTQGASNWVRISQLIQSRSPKQCRERYHQNLKGSLNLDPITPEEGILIERMVAEIGKRWAEIARRLHGRSDNAVKNWWNGGMNRRKRRDNRRAEMSAHHASNAMRPIHQAAGHHHAAPTVGHHTYEPMYAAPQYHYDQMPASAHVQSMPHAYPEPSRHTQPSRHMVEAPLPSPSAASYASRAESTGSAPPSLVSDVSVSSSYSQSPNVRYSTHELPSPVDQRDSYGRPIPKGYPQHNHYDPYPTRDANPTVVSNQPPKERYQHPPQQPYSSQPEHWKHRPSTTSSTPPARPTLPQLQLPGFQTLSMATPKTAEPVSPPRDQRMNVNALIH